MKKLPIILLTGFLGSGKTTILNRLLKSPEYASSAVLINEFGEIPLDHDLVSTVQNEAVVLDNGCVCCTVRGALSDALRTMFWQRVDKKLSPFGRVIIETTGLADPAPIIHELLGHPTILHHYRLAAVVACVDSVFGLGQLDTHPEALKQAALADTLLLTKTDLVPEESLTKLRQRLRSINPAATMLSSSEANNDFNWLNDAETYDPASKQLDVQNWLKAEAYRPVQIQPGSFLTGKRRKAIKDINRHGEDIHAFCLRFQEPLPWDALITALEILAAVRGEHLLRVKGIINAEGEEKPRVIHGVQHMFFPPSTLQRWPDGLRESRLVFIVRGLDEEFITNSILHFVKASRQQSHTTIVESN